MALVVDGVDAYGRRVLAGVLDHLGTREPWLTLVPDPNDDAAALAAWRGDGVVARIEHERLAGVVERLGLPTIDTGAARLLPGVPSVTADDAAIASLAAAHFREIGLRHVAFCGETPQERSDDLVRAFEAEMAGHGAPVAVLMLAAGDRRSDDDDALLGRWLAGLPRPVGILACRDALGRRLIDACHARGIAVPDEVVVLGVGDDDLTCRLISPSLSSVIPDARGAGRLAAHLLDRVLDGHEVAARHLVKPLGVAVRRSSDVLAVDDPLVAAAARFIRDHVARGIGVEDVAAAVHVSRRVLERRFVKAIARTPHDELMRMQFRLVEDLLRDTDLKLAAIARRCGFRRPQYMTAAFTKRYGTAPREWRQVRRD